MSHHNSNTVSSFHQSSAVCRLVTLLVRATVRQKRSLANCLVLLLICAGSTSTVSASLDDIGYTSLINALGAAAPTGAGITVSQVEAPLGAANAAAGAFAPNPTNAAFAGKNFNVLSNQPVDTNGNTLFSSHASTVGSNFYGTGSASPGIVDIDVYEANDFLFARSLRLGTSFEPVNEIQDIQNHSWVGDFGNNNQNQDAIRRLDFQVNRDDVTVVAALFNDFQASQPGSLFAASFNVIVSGVTDGGHVGGLVSVDSPSRQVPHIVAPSTFTSFANPFVSSGAAILLEHARSDASLSLADRNEVVRSLLLAGATKDEFASWTNSPTQPLDAVVGTGELHIHRSYDILDAGRQAASTTSVGDGIGWDLQTSATGEQTYFFDIGANQTLDEFSAVLTWNREITDTNPFAGFVAEFDGLNDLDLRLYSVDAGTFDLNSVLAESVSDGNVEHIYFNDSLGINTGLGTGGTLGAGRYAIVVDAGNVPQDFALSFLSEVSASALACDFNLDGQCDAADLELMYAEFGSTVALNFDLDGSGAVDQADITAWLAAASDAANPFNTDNVTYALGDVDFDGSVGSTDLGILLNNFSDSTDLAYVAGNLNADGIVDSTDLGLLLNNFGFSSSPAALAAAAAVPEPVGLAWIGAFLAFFAIRRRAA